MWSKYVGKAGIICVNCGLAGTRRFVMVGNREAGYFYMDEKAARQLISLVERGFELIEAKVVAIDSVGKPS